MSTRDANPARAARKAFLIRHPNLYMWLLGKRGVPLAQWEHCDEAGELYIAARNAHVYAPSTVRCDILTGMRGVAVEMLREKEEREGRAGAEAKAATQERIEAEVISLLERDGIDTAEVLRRVNRHFRRR